MIGSIFPKTLFTAVTRRHTEHRIVKTNPQTLLRIIANVDSYSSFLPLCVYSKIIRRHHQTNNNKTINNNSGEGIDIFDATLKVGMAPLFMEEYTSHVTVDYNALTVKANSIQSTLFDSLKSQWLLRNINNNNATNLNKNKATTTAANEEEGDSLWTEVKFEVEVTASDPAVVAMLDTMLSAVAGKQVEAFEKQCRQEKDIQQPHQSTNI